MIGIKPERVLFESADDVVDYVSRGLAPKREDFDTLISAVENPVDDEDAGGVYLNKSLFMDIDSATLSTVLRRVYENNRRKRNALLIGGGVTLAAITGLFIATAISHKKEVDGYEEKIKDLEKEIDEYEEL